MFLKIGNIYKKTPVLESLFKKVAGLEARKFIQRRLQHRYFPVYIAKFSKTAFSIEHTSGGCFWNWDIFLVCDTYNFKIYERSGHPDKYSYEILHEYLWW